MKYTIENLEKTSKYFQECLFLEKGKDALDFVKSRNINIDKIKQYEVGYCPYDYDYPSADSLYVDQRIWWIRGRLTVTIRDHYNRIISFSGRMLEKNKEKLYNDLVSKKDTDLFSYIDGNEEKIKNMVDDWSQRKWVNEIYSKKDYLYGLNIAKQKILEKGYAIIVEGYFDAISLWLNGFENTVALCGVAMTDMHTILLSRYCNHLVFCLDGDEGGNKGLYKIQNLINKKYYCPLSHYIIYLPVENGKGLDPEDTINSEKYKNVFLNALKETSNRKNYKKNYLDLNDNHNLKCLNKEFLF
jgi:DNA primase